MPRRCLGRVPAALLAAALLLSGSASAQPGCLPVSLSDQLSITVDHRPDHALIVNATVRLARTGSVYLEYGNEEIGWLRTPTSRLNKLHRIPLVRLRAETTYQARAFALDRAGCPAQAAATEFITGPLPAQLQHFVLESVGRPSFPLVVMNWPSAQPLGPANGGDRASYLLALDADDRVVWYYAVARKIPMSGTNLVVERLANGNWLYLTSTFGIEEISPDARVVRQFHLADPAVMPHHDFVQLPDRRVLFLGGEERVIDDTINGGREDHRLWGDTLHVLDLKTGAVEYVWSAFDTLDPLSRPLHRPVRRDDDRLNEDWTHANTVSLGPRGNIIISLRNLDQVISLSPDYTAVEWRLGGLDSDFAFPDPSDRFYGQHAVAELPGNRIVMFDNGSYRPDGEYSRALELELDFTTMTAGRVWEYRHQPDVFSDRISNAQRMPNGNTLVNFGYRADDPTAPALLVEARQDGTAAWAQSLKWNGTRASRYRAYPLNSLMGEVSVAPTAIIQEW